MSRKSQHSNTDQISSTKKHQTKQQVGNNHPITPNTTNIFLNQLLQTVAELEHYIRADHQQDYKLHMALEKQTERVYDLHACLINEKQRNQRLVDLIMNVDSCQSDEEEFSNGDAKSSGRNVINRWSLNSTKDTCDSISPLLMQQRYEELSTSYKHCRKQLLKKEKQLTLCKCDQEMVQSQYDHLMDEYRKAQKHFEVLCARYLRLQKKKNYEIEHLKESLTYASDCIITAQQVLDSSENHGSTHFEYHNKEFQQNLQLFMKSLQFCEWKQCQCCCSSHRIK